MRWPDAARLINRIKADIMDEISPNDVFGTDPSTLDMVEDEGYLLLFFL